MHDALIQTIQLGIGCTVAHLWRYITETADAELGWRQKFEIVCGFNAFGHVFSHGDVVSDGRSDALRAVILKGQPNFQCPKAARQLDAVVPKRKAFEFL